MHSKQSHGEHVACFSAPQSVAPHAGYDLVADEYYEPRHITSRNFDAATRAYFSEHPFSLPNHGLALDVGAGRGRLGEYCGVTAKRIIQGDISLKMLILPAREPALARVQADASALPFKTGIFSVVGAFLFDPFNESNFFEQVSRLISPGGIFVGTIPHYEWGLALRSASSVSEAIFTLRTGARVRQVSLLSRPDQLAHNLAGVGLHVVKNEVLTVPRAVTHVSPDIRVPAEVLRRSVYDIPIVQLVIATKYE